MLADNEERGPHALIGQCLQYGRRSRPRAIVKGEQDFIVAKEVMLFEMFKTETRSARCVDLDGARNPKRIRIFAFGRCGGRSASAALSKGRAAGNSTSDQKNACEQTAHG